MTLITLHGCTDWSVPLLFENTQDRFSCVKAHLAAAKPQTSLGCSAQTLHCPQEQSNGMNAYGPRREKTCLRGLRTTQVQNSLRIHAV